MRYLLLLLLVGCASVDIKEEPKQDICKDATIINSSSDLSILNDPDKSKFCFEEGEYKLPDLVTSGTKESPRQIIGNAVVDKLIFKSNHWAVDGITARNDKLHSHIRMQRGVNNITLNNMLIENGGGSSGMIAMGGDNLIIQNSTIRNTFVVPKMDDHCIVFYGKNNKVVNNKIYNCAGDGIQISGAGAEGGVISFNDIYVTPDYYSDGNGNLTPDGEFICGENALDFKGGGTATNPLIVKNNNIHGFNKPDDKNCATGGGGITAVVMHGKASEIIFEENLISDSTIGIIAANPTVTRVLFINNTFLDLDRAFSMPSNKAYDNEYIGNTFSNVANKGL